MDSTGTVSTEHSSARPTHPAPWPHISKVGMIEIESSCWLIASWSTVFGTLFGGAAGECASPLAKKSMGGGVV